MLLAPNSRSTLVGNNRTKQTLNKTDTNNNNKKPNILKLSIIDSTNSFAKERFDELRDRTAVVADCQTGGRGRAGRSWHSLEGNLFLTLVLKPNTPFTPTSGHASLTHYLGVTLCLLLEKMGLKPGLKWPNDILVEGKKIAGILAESVPMSRGKMGIVLGIGVNLDMPTADLETIDQPAISLVQLLSPAKWIARDRFLKLYLNLFFENYDRFLKKGFPLIQETYDSFMLYKGLRVRLQTEQSTFYGTIQGVSPSGSLLLLDDTNTQREYFAGDIWLEKSQNEE